MNNESLWPEFNDIPEIVTPVQIVKEQIAYLEQATGKTIIGEIVPVISLAIEGKQVYNLRITAPLVGNYSVDIFRMEYPILLYPVKIQSKLSTSSYSCTNEEEFKGALKEIFNSPQLLSILNSLLAQSKSAVRQK